MRFVYTVSLLSYYSIQLNKPNLAEVSPVVEIQQTNTPAKTYKPQKSESATVQSGEVEEEFSDPELSWEDEIDLEAENFDAETEEDFSDEDLYEEIIFQDNFDKEYREDVGDSYFEYPEEEEINIPEESEEE